MSSLVDLAVVAGIGFGAYWFFYSQIAKEADTILSNSAKNFEKIQEGVGWAMEQVGTGVVQGTQIIGQGVSQVAVAASQGVQQLDTMVKNTIDVGAGTIPSLEGCPAGYRDDGLTCMRDVSCRTYECGRLKGAFGEDWGAKLCTECVGADVKGKSSTCGGKVNIDGLCYNKCPDAYNRVPGMPYLCRK